MPVDGAATRLIVAQAVLTSFALLVLALRFVSMRKVRRSFKPHDGLAIFATICLLGYTIDFTAGEATEFGLVVKPADTYRAFIHKGSAFDGIGLDIGALSHDQFVSLMKVFLASQYFWMSGVASFRLAIILLYIEIFETRRFKIVAHLTGLVVILYWIACLITSSTSCIPLSVFWDLSEHGRCINSFAVSIFSALFTMVLDLWVVILPMPIVWRLQMPLRQKIGVTVTFSLGIVISLINLGRFIQTFTCKNANFSHCVWGSSIIVVGELTTGITAACAPLLGPLLFPSGIARKSRHHRPSTKPLQYRTTRSAQTMKESAGISISDVSPFPASTTIGNAGSIASINPWDKNDRHLHGEAVVLDDEIEVEEQNSIRVRRDLQVYQTVEERQ